MMAKPEPAFEITTFVRAAGVPRHLFLAKPYMVMPQSKVGAGAGTAEGRRWCWPNVGQVEQHEWARFGG